MERDGHSRARTAGISGQIRWVQPGKYSGFSRKDVNVKCSVTMSCHVMSCNVNCHIKCFPYFLYFKYFRTFLQQSYREEGHTEKIVVGRTEKATWMHAVEAEGQNNEQFVLHEYVPSIGKTI